MARNALKLSTIVGEKFEIYFSQMAKKCILSTMVGEYFEIYVSQMGKWLKNVEICIYKMAGNALKLSTMLVEHFEIYFSQMAKKIHLNCPLWLGKIL